MPDPRPASTFTPPPAGDLTRYAVRASVPARVILRPPPVTLRVDGEYLANAVARGQARRDRSRGGGESL